MNQRQKEKQKAANDSRSLLHRSFHSKENFAKSRALWKVLLVAFGLKLGKVSQQE